MICGGYSDNFEKQTFVRSAFICLTFWGINETLKGTNECCLSWKKDKFILAIFVLKYLRNYFSDIWVQKSIYWKIRKSDHCSHKHLGVLHRCTLMVITFDWNYRLSSFDAQNMRANRGFRSNHEISELHCQFLVYGQFCAKVFVKNRLYCL